MRFIRTDRITKKLQQAERTGDTLYIHGSVGMGKTTAVRKYLAKTPYLYLSGADGALREMPEPEKIGQKVVVIDDLSEITDNDCKNYIDSFVRTAPQQIILIGRGNVPEWLRTTSVERHFIMATNKDLELKDEEVLSLLSGAGSDFSDASQDSFLTVLEDSHRNNLLLMFIEQKVEEEGVYSQRSLEGARRAMFDYMEQTFLRRLPKQIREAAMALSQFSRFSVQLAEMVTANSRIRSLFKDMESCGDFLVADGDDSYHIAPIYREFLFDRAKSVLSARQVAENYERAALYYELRDELLSALECYRLADNADRVEELLVRIADSHPGMVDYLQTKRYFDLLPAERISRTPSLMGGMAMISALELKQGLSDYWYQRLSDYTASVRRGSAEYREAAEKLHLLDLMLPQRGTAGLLGRIKSPRKDSGAFRGTAGISDKTPSILNGWFDMTTLAPQPGQSITVSASVLMSDAGKQPSEAVLTPEGGMQPSTAKLPSSAGIVQSTPGGQIPENVSPDALIKMLTMRTVDLMGPTAYCYGDLVRLEYLFEVDRITQYDLSARANEVYLRSDTLGSDEMCFAAIGVMARGSLFYGGVKATQTTLQFFRQKVEKKGDRQLLENIDTMDMWLGLHFGDQDKAKEWIAQTPDSTQGITVLDFYMFVNKVRVLIMLGRKNEAMSLMGRLRSAFVQFKRQYYRVQLEVLHAILLFSEGEEDGWKQSLHIALHTAASIGFFHVISDEGAALKPLLDLYRDPDLPEEYMDKVRKMTDRMAVSYPMYLKTSQGLDIPLTDTEHRVLRLLCNNYSTDEICDELSISNSGLKFHKQNIYRKLGVRNRNEAQRTAKSLGLNLQ